MFESIKGYEDGKLMKVVDENLVVNLVAKTPYFLELTAFPTFSPVKKTLLKNMVKLGLWPETYIGNGLTN